MMRQSIALCHCGKLFQTAHRNLECKYFFVLYKQMCRSANSAALSRLQFLPAFAAQDCTEQMPFLCVQIERHLHHRRLPQSRQQTICGIKPHSLIVRSSNTALITRRSVCVLVDHIQTVQHQTQLPAASSPVGESAAAISAIYMARLTPQWRTKCRGRCSAHPLPARYTYCVRAPV